MNRTHGHATGGTVTPEYRAWHGALDRCYRETAKKFPQYGGRGITVCDRWRNSFADFLADMGPRPSSLHSLDRFPNTNGHYEPDNCRWATQEQQQRNRTDNRQVEIDGQSMCLAQAAETYGLRYGLVKRRLQLGWDADLALKTPAGGISSRKFQRTPR